MRNTVAAADNLTIAAFDTQDSLVNRFSNLDEREELAPAVANEEDGPLYADLAQRMRTDRRNLPGYGGPGKPAPPLVA